MSTSCRGLQAYTAILINFVVTITAAGVDYQTPPPPLIVTFSAGSEGPQVMTSTFNVFGDTDVEPDETIIVTATVQESSVCLFDSHGLVGSPSDTFTLTILMDGSSTYH